ncbi:MAG TPA: hypothetical protein VG323_01385 [Thermoanaerobaculia bacterium]|nr:hypothetical protein [Thermoanaerobaculia bacterium]
MRTLTLSTEQVMVYDDVLPAETFDALLPHVTTLGFSVVHQDEWRKVWRLGDGMPLEGTTTFYRPGAGTYEDEEEPHYPTGTVIDRVIEAIHDAAADAAGVVGRAGVEWNCLTVAPSIYPQGSGLSLHRNHYGYSGSYGYFIHHDWNFHWGGQLLVLHPRTGNGDDADDSPFTPPFLSDEDENRAAAEPGIGLSILPKPNRLVFVAAGTYEMITRVDANAGNRPRVALSGFFI